MKQFFRVFLSIAFASPLLAAEPVQQQNSNAIWFGNWDGLSNATLVVVAPNGQITDVTAEAGTPVYQLNSPEVLDGIYRFKLRAQTNTEIPIVTTDDNNGREPDPSASAFEMFQTTGFFIVERGIIITPPDTEEEDG